MNTKRSLKILKFILAVFIVYITLGTPGLLLLAMVAFAKAEYVLGAIISLFGIIWIVVNIFAQKYFKGKIKALQQEDQKQNADEGL